MNPKELGPREQALEGTRAPVNSEDTRAQETEKAARLGKIEILINQPKDKPPELSLVTKIDPIQTMHLANVFWKDNAEQATLDAEDTPSDILITEPRPISREETLIQIAKSLPAFLRDLGVEQIPSIYLYEGLPEFTNGRFAAKIDYGKQVTVETPDYLPDYLNVAL